MRHLMILTSILFGCFFGDCLQAYEGVTQEIEQIDRKILSHRAGIHSIVAQVDFKLCAAGPCSDADYSLGRFSYYMDAKSTRIDRSYAESNSPAKRITATDVTTDSSNITWNDKPGSTGSYRSVMFREGKLAAVQTSKQRLPNLLLIGLVPASFQNYVYYNLESYIGNGDRNDLKITPDLRNDKLLKISYVTKFGLNVYYVVDTDKDFSVIELNLLADDGKQRREHSVLSTLSQDKKTGLWFPNECMFEEKLNGSLVMAQNLHVVIESINQTVDPRMFQLAGLNLPSGVGVTRLTSDTDKSGSYVWDGTLLKKVDRFDNIEQNKGQPNNRFNGKKFLLINGLVILMLAACVIIHGIYRRSRSRPNSA